MHMHTMPSSLSIEQRLAALAVSQPSTSKTPKNCGSSGGGEATHLRSFATVSSPRRYKPDKPAFSTWSRRELRNERTGFSEKELSMEEVQLVIGRLIFQAGVDFETRPIVVFASSALPDPKEVSYDVLFSQILSYLELYVESDYTVVYFAAGGRHTPPTSWIWKAYRSLNRKYRKNLKQLYVVHPSLFSKMLFSVAGAIISPKFFRKIVYIKTLSDLAQLVPLTQIDVPPSVYKENLKFEKKITIPIPTNSDTFGVPLEELMGYEGEKGGLPRVVRDSIQYIYENGLTEIGIFRRCPQLSMLKAAQDAYDRGNVVSLDKFGDPHIAAVLLKKFLRALPEPLFSEDLYPVIQNCPLISFPNEIDDDSHVMDDLSSVAYIRETLLPLLPPCVYIILSHVLQLMHEISLRSNINKMTASNLSLVLCPNLVNSNRPALDVVICGAPGSVPAILQSNSTVASPIPLPDDGQTSLGSIIRLCIERYYEVFDEVKDRGEVLNLPSPPRPYRNEGTDVDVDSIDDAMLVMPVGPGPSPGDVMSTLATHRRGRSKSNAVPPKPPFPSTQATFADEFGGDGGGGALRGKSSFRRYSSYATTVELSGSAEANLAATMNSDESLAGSHVGFGTISGRRGSLSVSIRNCEPGMGLKSVTMRKPKAVGSGVEAIGITAKGFFAPPGKEVSQTSEGEGEASQEILRE